MRRKPRKRTIERLESRLPLAGFIVTTPNDVLDDSDGQLSLREAVIAANTNSDVDDEISFAPEIRGRVLEISRAGLEGQDTPETGDLDVTTGQVTIHGWGREGSQIESQVGHRLFQVSSGATLLLSRMSLQHGNAGRGGAVLVVGTLETTDVRFRDNVASNDGGAIFISEGGTAVLRNTFLQRNSSVNGGAVLNEGTLVVRDAQLMGNEASGRGGAVFSIGDSASIDLESVGIFDNAASGGAGVVNDGGTAFIVNSSFANNRADWGGVILNRSDQAERSRLTILQSTLVAGSNLKTATVHTASRGTGVSETRIGNSIININGDNPTLSTFVESSESAVEVISLGHNHFSDTGGSFATQTDLTGVNLVTDGHMDTTISLRGGGGASVREVFATSPTIDAGDPSLAVDSSGNQLQYDQRGVGLRREFGDAVDIGAVEFQQYYGDQLLVTTLEDTVDPHDGLLSLREVINRANAGSDPDTIHFENSLFDDGEEVLGLKLGCLLITTPMSIVGPGSALFAVDGGGLTRVFDVWTGEFDASIVGLTIQGGATFADDDYLDFQNAGAAVRARNAGMLNLRSVVVADNHTSGSYGHGAVSVIGGNAVVENSVFEGNSTSGYRANGVALFQWEGIATISDSEFLNNVAYGTETHGAGIFVNYGDLSVRDSAFRNNVTEGFDGWGGGIAVDGGDAAILRSVIRGNVTKGSYASGAGLRVSGTLRLTDSEVTQNQTSGFRANGAGIGSQSEVILTRSIVSANETHHPESSGGGIAIGGYIDSGRIELEESVLTGNQSEQGAELWFSSNNTENFDIVARLIGEQTLDFTDFDHWQFQTPVDQDGDLYTAISHQDAQGSRLLIDSDRQWRNSLEPSDVNGDGSVSPLDALLIINAIARRQVDGGQSTFLDPPDESMWPYAFVDQNGDGHISPLDALRVINEIARSASVTAFSASKIIKTVEAETLSEDDFVRDALFSLF